MELSSIELRYLVNEIRSRVISGSSGYYVSSINAITKSSLFLRLHHPMQEDIMLVFSTRGIWITRLKLKPMEENNSLENIAQKELERAKMELIEQVGSERIVSLKFRHPDGKVRIVVGEFFGNGNIIICNENMQIIAILNPIQVRHRTLNVGLRYVYPPARGVDVFDITLDQMLYLRDEGKDLDVLRWIGRSVSMPKKFAEEVISRAVIQVDKHAAQLSNDEVSKIYNTVKDIVNEVSTGGKNHEPIVIMLGNKPQEALPIITQETAIAAKMIKENNIKKVASYMDAVDEVLSSEIMEIGRSSRTVELDRQIAVLEHDLEEQNKAKETVLQKAAAIRKLAGELMSVSYRESNEISDVLANHFASLITEKGVKYIEVAGEQVKMHPSLAKASSMLFARAKEMERGNASIEEARAKLLAQIEKLRSETAAIHKKVIVKEQVSKEWYERYRWFITTDGLLVIGGRDASSNSALIRKHLTEHDIVFHAEVHGSPFFIIKNAATFAATQEGTINSSLYQVAQATISFSRAWKDGLSSADAYWVMPEQVKKGAPTGQFLPKGSFVIEGKRNYLKGVELRLAIGIMQLNNRETVLCGPEEAIKKHSIFYAVILQGGMDPMNAAKKVKSEFVKIADDNIKIAESIKHISLDEFVRALPTGQSRLSFTARGQQQLLQEAASLSPSSPSVAAESGDK
ncbi:MAG TPA: ribosome rescue protein RqcH [Nitrososphaera sp.]|jgi:predicted ribosome quality control (RQC) complex YloA/Tae2 family protein|nr:ribosome rescue protein RqcH [Nitrososphaera sp.]